MNGEVLDGGVNKNLRTDTTSISALSSLNGTLVVAGTGQYPDYGTGAGEFGDTYDHTEAIVSNADTR